MRYLILIVISFGVSIGITNGQQTFFFDAEAFPDTVLLGEVFSVHFMHPITDENYSFDAPKFKDFVVLDGPIEMRGEELMADDNIKTFMGHQYAIQAVGLGEFYIKPARLTIAGNLYTTKPLKIVVLPNPGGISQPDPFSQSGGGKGSGHSGGAIKVDPNQPMDPNSPVPPTDPMEGVEEIFMVDPETGKMKKLNKEEQKDLFQKFEPVKDSTKVKKKKKVS